MPCSTTTRRNILPARVVNRSTQQYSPRMNNNVFLSPLRHYRQQYTRHAGEQAFQVVVEETDLHVTASADLAADMGRYVSALRG